MGKGGGIASTIGRVGSGVFTLGGSEIARNNLGTNSPVSQLLQVPGAILTGGASGPGNIPSVFGGGATNQYISGPFSLDAAQLANDQGLIKGLGATQDAQNQQFITDDAASRSSSRDALAKALTSQGQNFFAQGLPQTEETLNAQHLLNGSGLGQEISRQQGYLASNIANQLGVQGAQDINRSSDQKAAALQSLQGFGQSSLGRQLSLEDFINQANVAKTIGAQAAPQVGNGKGQTGTLLSGVGALAPLAKVGMTAGKAATGNVPGAIASAAA